MTIKAVFRVQCDGPCKGWLSEAGEVVAAYGSHTARVIGHWQGERSARTAALNNGWEYTGKSPWNPEGQHATARGGTLLCPTCKLTPPVRLGTHDTWSICHGCAS